MKFVSKWSLYGMSSFHFYRWNQFKVILLACTCTPYKNGAQILRESVGRTHV